jgi:hypothetical protein
VPLDVIKCKLWYCSYLVIAYNVCNSCQFMHFMTFHVMSCHVIHVSSFHVISRHIMSYHVISCHFMCHWTFTHCHSIQSGGRGKGQICHPRPSATAVGAPTVPSGVIGCQFCFVICVIYGHSFPSWSVTSCVISTCPV